MLPIRLRTVNADGMQELFIYLLTKQGRVETTNYRTVRVPEAQDVADLRQGPVRRFLSGPLLPTGQAGEPARPLPRICLGHELGVIPCAANPLSAEELRNLGVFGRSPKAVAGDRSRQARTCFSTRLHVRYDAAHFPEDLVFQETSDRANFQARYIIRHAWTGTDACARPPPTENSYGTL